MLKSFKLSGSHLLKLFPFRIYRSYSQVDILNILNFLYFTLFFSHFFLFILRPFTSTGSMSPEIPLSKTKNAGEILFASNRHIIYIYISELSSKTRKVRQLTQIEGSLLNYKHHLIWRTSSRYRSLRGLSYHF